jgi:hypothetical protein
MNANPSWWDELYDDGLFRRVETPIARARDPESSHRAAAEITTSGTRAHQQAQTVAAVRAFPGCTSQELSERTGLERYMLARRLPEAVTAGRVRKGEQRTCAVTGRLALTWWTA